MEADVRHAFADRLRLDSAGELSMSTLATSSRIGVPSSFFTSRDAL
jgi:hypothetical protein